MARIEREKKKSALSNWSVEALLAHVGGVGKDAMDEINAVLAAYTQDKGIALRVNAFTHGELVIGVESGFVRMVRFDTQNLLATLQDRLPGVCQSIRVSSIAPRAGRAQ